MKDSFGLQFLDLHPFVRQTILDRVRGTIFGGALGDAIGLYTGNRAIHEVEISLTSSRILIQGLEPCGISGGEIPISRAGDRA
jgi:hypothetical protein